MENRSRPDRSFRRNRSGTPIIEADDLRDLFRKLGYAHACDRRGQMIFMRILGQGRISELLDPSHQSLEADIFFREMNWANAGREQENALTEQAREIALAYCQGVNEFGLKVPLPMRLATRSYKPERWTVDDIFLMTRMTAYLTLAQSQGELERLIIQMIQSGVPRKRLQELFPALEDDFDEELIRKLQLHRKVVPDSVRWKYSAARMMASNNWVIGGGKSASGKPILAGDVHLEVNRLPNVFCEQILQAAGRYFVGATIPGVPGLVMGRTQDVAWSPTYAFIDAQDSWIERCRGGNYLASDEAGESWSPIPHRDELILRRGKAPYKLRLYSTRHGLLDCVPEDGYSLATSWAVSHSGAQTLNNSVRLWDAKSVAEARSCLSRFESAWNWVLADRHGEIGYQMSGMVPKRRPGASGLLPLPGWKQISDWQGMIAPDSLPRCVNPAKDYFATANNDLNQFGKVAPINAPMSSYRADRISELLEQKDGWSIHDIKQMQYDVQSRQAADVMQILRPLLPDTAQGRILRGWNCSYELTSQGAYLFEVAYKAILLAVFGEGGLGTDAASFLHGETGIFADFYGNFDRVLMSQHSAWFFGEQRDELYRRVLEKALRIPPAKWEKRQHILLSYLPLQGAIPGLLSLLRINRSLCLPGGRATIQQGQIYRSAGRQTTFAPAYRFITDLSTEEAHTNLAGGPAESPFSRWYCSDLKNWLKGRYKVMGPHTS